MGYNSFYGGEMFLSKIIKNLSKVTMLVIFSLLFMTCDPGLGKAVDTQAPKVSVSFPATKSVLKGGFTMKGVASDEVKVEGCIVTFKNIKTSQEYNFNATVSGGEFKVNINTPKPNGTFELPDGDYNVTVTVSDAYRNSTADVVYTIDNTSPTVLLTSPNVYVESNWPSMYKLFTIKGEVYDFTTISEVKVFIVDSEGNVIVEKVAEGTNTFLASFENPNIPTGKTCFYYAVAKDAGGNENTYCYHKQDIYALISQQQKNSTFPSINAIGYVDQNVEDTFNGSIDNELLGTKKIENVKPGSEKGNRPGFDFFDKDTAQIKWLNISEDGESSIGIGSPIIGTIMPPTDGSSVLDVEVWVAKETSMDVFEEYSDENKIETDWGETVDGSIIYEGQCELKQVGDSVNFQINSHDVGSEDEWPSSKYKVKVKFITNSDMEGYAECVFEVASGAPKVTEGNFSQNPNASYYRGFMTAQTLASGKNYLKGISKTSDEANQVSLSYEISGSSIAIENAQMDGNGNYEIQVPIDAVNHTKDGEHTYTLTAKGAELTTVISRVVVIDTTNPVVNFTNLTNEQVVPSKDFVVRGNVEDANGISKVEYQLYADGNQIALDGTSSGSGWILLPGVNGSFDLSLKNLNKDVNYELKIRTTDAAGNTTGEEEYKRQFTLDNTNPEIKVNSVSPQIEYHGKDTVNGSITVNLSVTDTNTIKEFYYTFDNSVADDSNWSAQGNKVKSFDSTSGVQKLEINTTEYEDGSELPLRIKAVDEAGNSNVVKVNPVVNQESDKPSISPSNFDPLNDIGGAGWQGVTSVNVFGKSNPNMIFTVADDDLVKEYYAKLNEGQFKKIGDVNSAQKIVTYPLTEIIENYERHKITLRIVDDKYVNDSSTPNNYVEEVFYVAIDDGQPELRLNNANGQFVGNEFTISGIAKDGNGIECVTLQSEGGNVYSTLGIGSGLDNGNFSYTFRLNELATKDPIIITAVDIIGNASTTTFTYRVDSTPPTVNFDRNEVGYVDGDSPNLKLQGYAIDGEKSGDDNDVSKIDQVRVKIGSPVTSINDENSILATGKVDDNGKMTWSALLDFAGYEAGKYTVYAAAFDFAGNMSEVQDSVEIPVDADIPTIESSYEQVVSNSPILISGQASDNSGIKSVSAKVQGSQKDIVVNYNQTSDETPSDWSFYVPTDAGQGQLTIVVTATDVCGKSTNETFVAVIDTEAPDITFTDIADDDSNNETIETSKTTDKPRVSVTYSDITSGVKTIDYTFYYYDAEQDKFVDYSSTDGNAKGTFTRDKSFSGTVVMKMAESTGSKGPFVFTDSDTDGIWYVKVTVTDEAGNSAEYDSPYFYVDQHKPELEVTSPAPNVNLKKQNDALTVTGTTSDSYGGDIDKVVVKIFHTSYNASQQANFTKTFTKDGSNGTESLTKNGESYQFTYTWDSANSPFVYPDVYELLVSTYDVAGNETVRTPQKISCDNTAPTITFSRPYSYSVDAFGNVNEGIVVNSPIGDTSIKALADDYSMASIYYQIGGTVDIEATGSIGSSNYKITKLTVENGGVGTDTYGTSVTDVKLDGVNIALAGNWNKLTSANLDFDVEYNTLNMVNAGKTYHADGDKETIQTLDVHFVAVDTAGNINYCKYPLKVDTDTDKPTLLMLSPKTINDVANVGGTATISGTVNDDNAVHSVWMQVELVNGNYNGNVLSGFTALTYGITEPQVLVEDIVDGKPTYSSESTLSYFADRTKWYKVNLGAENSTSTTWNMMLNKNGEFDIAKLKETGSLPNNDALKQTELLIKVKALDTKANDGLSISSDAKVGDSTEFRLIIDSGSPSIIINNIADFPSEGSYIGGNITFDLEFSDDQSITEWKVEAISSASGDNRSMLIASGKYSGTYDVGMGKTVKPVADGKYVGSNGIITVDTADIYAQCGNLIQFKISAKDNSKDPQSQTESPKESYLTFKYTIDNSAPDASLVSTIDSKSYYIDTESVIGDNGAHRETIARGNHLRIMSDQAAFTGKVFDEANGSGIDYVMLYFTKENRLYNPSEVDSSFEISNHLSVKDKDGNSVSPLSPVGSLKDVVRTSGTSNPYIVVDRAEGMLDSGANGDLDGYDENLKANGDWVVYIKSSNLPDGVYDIHYVVVDFAGNARYYSDTMLVQNYAPKITSIVLATDIDGDGQASIGNDDKGDEYQKFVTREFTSTGFVVRNSKLKIKVNVTGGTGALKYYLRYKTTNGEVTTNSSNPGYSTGEFEVTDFLGDSGIPVDYVVWVEDSVEKKLSLSSGETTIDMIMDNEDDVAPVTQFFELNTIVESSSGSNSNRGSLYKVDGSIKGHIEPRQNSPVDNTSGKDPDVSGTIILRGEALDNQRIKSIVLKLNGSNVTIAEWNSTTKQLESQNGARIVDDLGLAGHYTEWSYAWDTNAIIKYDVQVDVIVNDASSKQSNSTVYNSTDNKPRTNGDGGTVDNRFSSDGWGYNSMTVDAVPYITNLSRGSVYNTNRAKSGATPLLRDQTGNKIEGFNLSKANNTSGTYTIALTQDSKVTFNNDGSVNGTVMSYDNINGTFSVPGSARDGYLSVIVNGIPSINNINENKYEYNREGNEYDNKTTYWTDDRYVRIWQNNSDDYFPGSGNPVYPAMSIGSNGDLYASFSNYTDAAVYYSQRGGSKTKIFAMYDPSEETDIHVSGTGTVNVVYSANYQGGGDANWTVSSGDAGGIYVYDYYAKAKQYSTTYGYCKFIKHELFYHNKMLQQFKNIRVKRSNTAEAGLVHIAYYDRLSSSIHYSNSPGNTQHNAGDNECSWVNIDGGTDEHDTNTYKDGSSIALSGNAFETGVSRAAGTGEYVGLALTKSRYPVLVYFDSSNKVLKLARASQENPKGNNGNWKVQSVIKDTSILGVSVESITCDIDSDGKIHIAFQNGKNQLVYIKSTNASANGSSSYTFDSPVVVAEGASWVDLTLYGTTPYISYLSGVNSYDGLNLAFFDKTIDTNFDGVADGSWEAMVAPLAYKATSIRTNVEVHPSPSTSTWGEAAIGFTPGDYYRLAFYIGSGKGH